MFPNYVQRKRFPCSICIQSGWSSSIHSPLFLLSLPICTLHPCVFHFLVMGSMASLPPLWEPIFSFTGHLSSFLASTQTHSLTNIVKDMCQQHGKDHTPHVSATWERPHTSCVSNMGKTAQSMCFSEPVISQQSFPSSSHFFSSTNFIFLHGQIDFFFFFAYMQASFHSVCLLVVISADSVALWINKCGHASISFEYMPGSDMARSYIRVFFNVLRISTSLCSHW